MSSTFLDAGDMQRLDRERNLVRTNPRQEEPLDVLNVREEPENPFDSMLDGILDGLKGALKRRLL